MTRYMKGKRCFRYFVAMGLIFLSTIYWYRQTFKFDYEPWDAVYNCDTERDKNKQLLEDYRIMVAVYLTEEESGYANFTKSTFEKVLCIPDANIHVFGKDSPNINYIYGNNASYQILDDSASLVEVVVDIFKYFRASKFDALLAVTGDMVISPKFFDFISHEIFATDILQLFRNYTECQLAGDQLCVNASPLVFGSVINKSLIDILLNDIASLQEINKYNVGMRQSNIKSVFSEESFVLHIRQTFHRDGCVEYFQTYNFNRCVFPKWARRGMEFYLDKCNRPRSPFDGESASDTIYAKPVVSYSLFGGAYPRYTDGAIANSELMFTIYPEWKMWVYYDNSVPSSVLETLCSRNVKLINMSGRKLENQMSWRFLVASEPVNRYIIRDVDSRLSMRERAAVYEWIESGKKFHVMRDHPAHSLYAISGGMWGGTHDAIPTMKAILENLSLSASYLKDMDFLGEKVWPVAQESVWQNDAFPNGQYGLVHPFPTTRIGVQHVGSVYINGKQREYDIVILKKAMESLERK